MYHRVIEDSEYDTCLSQHGMVVSRSVFEGQMSYIKNAYRVISMTEMIDEIENGTVNNCECTVTFDDGWRDVYLNAYNIMRNHRIPAMIYLSTGFIGTSELFWPEKVSQALLNRDSSGEMPSLTSIDQDCALLVSQIISSNDRKTSLMLLDSLIELLKHLSSEKM